MRAKIIARKFKTAGEYWYDIAIDNVTAELSVRNEFTSRKKVYEAVRKMYQAKVWDLRKERVGYSILV